MTDQDCRLCDGHGWLMDMNYPHTTAYAGPLWKPIMRYGDRGIPDFKGHPDVMACPACNKLEE